MCRYAMSRYKPHYACFNCRKTFKRKLIWDINRDDKRDEIQAKCPQCGKLMANMGLDFESPRKGDIKKWEHLKTLYKVGITFHSCGCSGPGYIPRTNEKLIEYFHEQITSFSSQLVFWRNRTEPTNTKEIDRDYSKNGHYFYKIPKELGSRKSPVKNQDAINFWIDRIKNVENKLAKLK